MLAILAVFKCGGAYLPLEPEHPTARLEFILTDSKAKVLLTNKHTYSEFLKLAKNKQDIVIEHVVYLDEPLPAHNLVMPPSLNNTEDI